LRGGNGAATTFSSGFWLFPAWAWPRLRFDFAAQQRHLFFRLPAPELAWSVSQLAAARALLASLDRSEDPSLGHNVGFSESVTISTKNGTSTNPNIDKKGRPKYATMKIARAATAK
jgi:hypothetical protein